jgi:hypothetical protein
MLSSATAQSAYGTICAIEILIVSWVSYPFFLYQSNLPRKRHEYTERTKTRPLASGQISMLGAGCLLAILFLVETSLLALACDNSTA